jgi:hypothetical protein
VFVPPRDQYGHFSSAVQVLIAVVLIHALHAALKDAVEAFDGVGVHLAILKVHILASAVIGPTMGVKHFASANAFILARLVCHDDGLGALGGAIHQCEHFHLVRAAARLWVLNNARFFAVGFVKYIIA